MYTSSSTKDGLGGGKRERDKVFGLETWDVVSGDDAGLIRLEVIARANSFIYSVVLASEDVFDRVGMEMLPHFGT